MYWSHAQRKGRLTFKPCLSPRTGLLQEVQMAYKDILFDLEESQAVEQVMQGACAASVLGSFQDPAV